MIVQPAARRARARREFLRRSAIVQPVVVQRSSWFPIDLRRSSASFAMLGPSPGTVTSPAPAEELHIAAVGALASGPELEAELGAELAERTSRSVVPTEAGARGRRGARRVLSVVGDIRGEVDELRGARPRGESRSAPYCPRRPRRARRGALQRGASVASRSTCARPRRHARPARRATRWTPHPRCALRARAYRGRAGSSEQLERTDASWSPPCLHVPGRRRRAQAACGPPDLGRPTSTASRPARESRATRHCRSDRFFARGGRRPLPRSRSRAAATSSCCTACVSEAVSARQCCRRIVHALAPGATAWRSGACEPPIRTAR